MRHSSRARWNSLQWGHDLAVMETMLIFTRRRCCGLLQWGHDLAVMETTGAVSLNCMVHLLQWGHDLAVMETGQCRHRFPVLPGASMGP